jgi:transposase InsO family protein
MSRSGNVWDGAAMESSFSPLKTERTARNVYRTCNEAGADVFDYIRAYLQSAAASLHHRLNQPWGVRTDRRREL